MGAVTLVGGRVARGTTQVGGRVARGTTQVGGRVARGTTQVGGRVARGATRRVWMWTVFRAGRSFGVSLWLPLLPGVLRCRRVR